MKTYNTYAESGSLKCCKENYNAKCNALTLYCLIKPIHFYSDKCDYTESDSERNSAAFWSSHDKTARFHVMMYHGGEMKNIHPCHIIFSISLFLGVYFIFTNYVLSLLLIVLTFIFTINLTTSQAEVFTSFICLYVQRKKRKNINKNEHFPYYCPTIKSEAICFIYLKVPRKLKSLSGSLNANIIMLNYCHYLHVNYTDWDSKCQV